jgi:hypothetical protein
MPSQSVTSTVETYFIADLRCLTGLSSASFSFGHRWLHSQVKMLNDRFGMLTARSCTRAAHFAQGASYFCDSAFRASLGMCFACSLVCLNKDILVVNKEVVVANKEVRMAHQGTLVPNEGVNKKVLEAREGVRVANTEVLIANREALVANRGVLMSNREMLVANKGMPAANGVVLVSHHPV